jgi:hypothetical protein
MSDLQNQTPADTYKGLLQVGDYTDGVDSTAKYISDGEGTPSALSISESKVGVGTASPDSKLEIVDSSNHLNLKVADTVSQSVIRFSDSNGLAGAINYDHNTDKLHFITDGTAIPTNGALNIDSDGNLGVGVTNPTRPLDIQITDATAYAEDGAGNALRVRNTSQAADTFSSLEMFAGQTSVGGANIARIFAIKESTTSTATSLAFTTRASNEVSSEAMRITSDGNLGVGVTNPSSAFEVKSNTDEAILKGISPNGLSNVFIKKTNTGDTEFSNAFVSGGTAGDFFFTNGKVGIGTVSPSAPLEVDSTTGGVIIPRISNSQRNLISSPTDGEMIYNTTTNRFQGRANGAWVDFH